MSGAVVSHRAWVRIQAAGWSLGGTTHATDHMMWNGVASHPPQPSIRCAHKHRTLDLAIQCAQRIAESRL